MDRRSPDLLPQQWLRSNRVLAAARRARRPARIASVIAIVSGLINLVSAMLPADAHRLNDLKEVIPGQVSSKADALVAAAGIAMLLLANALHRRSRTAWAFLVGLLLLSAGGHVVKGLDLEEAMFETFLAGYLVGAAEHFTARPDRGRSIRARLTELAGVVFAAYAFGVIGLFTREDVSFRHALHGGFDLLLRRDTGIAMSERVQDVMTASVTALLVLGLLIVLYRTLAPAPGRKGSPATPEEALASNDSLAWFATRDDKHIMRVQDAGVSYGYFGSVALASGDPLGDPNEWDDAIDEFASAAARQGRYAAVLGCGADAASVYQRHGFRQLYMGDEAVLHLESFTLQGGSMKTVRNSCTRATKAGYVAKAMRVGDIDAETVAKLRALSKKWRQGQEERGFSMSLGRLFEDEDAQAMVVVGYDGDGEPRGFLHFVPWTTSGASLDIMRRDRDAIAVLNDFLVAESARLLPELGVNRISLNFSALRGLLVAGSEENAPWNLKVQRWLLLRLSTTFQIETLYRFNKKFNPEWVPRYLMLGALEDAPVVLFAALRAEGLLPSYSPRDKKTGEEDAA
jgi:lysyl-tRNA synthetase, class II